MKKRLLLIVTPFAFFSLLSAQTTWIEADEIVLERMSTETQSHTVYAQATIQADSVPLITSAGETLELNYSCWVYFVRYHNWQDADATPGRYLIVNASNGNLLEIHAKNDDGPNDLETWREVSPIIYPITIETTGFSLPEGFEWDYLTPDSLYRINSQGELIQHLIYGTDALSVVDTNVVSAVDLNNYTLLVFSPKYCNVNSKVEKLLFQQVSATNYLLSADVIPSLSAVATPLIVSVLVPKMEGMVDVVINGMQVCCYNENYSIEIPFTEYSLEGTSCLWKKFQDGDYKNEGGEVVIVNSDEKLASHVECTGENNYLKIDFSKYTLLLVRGVQHYLVVPDYTMVQQLSAQNYVININLRPHLAAVITYWQVPIIIAKIIDNVNIELKVTKNP